MLSGGEAFGRGLGHEGGISMSGISTFRKGPRELPLPIQPSEDGAGMWLSLNQEASLPETKSASPLILDFLTFRTMRNKCLFLATQAMGFLLQQPKQTMMYCHGSYNFP